MPLSRDEIEKEVISRVGLTNCRLCSGKARVMYSNIEHEVRVGCSTCSVYASKPQGNGMEHGKYSDLDQALRTAKKWAQFCV